MWSSTPTGGRPVKRRMREGAKSKKRGGGIGLGPSGGLEDGRGGVVGGTIVSEKRKQKRKKRRNRHPGLKIISPRRRWRKRKLGNRKDVGEEKFTDH